MPIAARTSLQVRTVKMCFCSLFISLLIQMRLSVKECSCAVKAIKTSLNLSMQIPDHGPLSQSRTADFQQSSHFTLSVQRALPSPVKPLAPGSFLCFDSHYCRGSTEARRDGSGIVVRPCLCLPGGARSIVPRIRNHAVQLGPTQSLTAGCPLRHSRSGSARSKRSQIYTMRPIYEVRLIGR